ncbi:MAG: O-antigen ligase family protein [Planctomycetes bacterium]|nr:O-antigen ligase family protein [Planctomycetota bacterium]
MGRLFWLLAAALAFAAVVAVPVVFDPAILQDVIGLNGTLEAKHAVLRAAGFLAAGCALLSAAIGGRRIVQWSVADVPVFAWLAYCASTLSFASDRPSGIGALFSLVAAVAIGVIVRTVAAIEGPGRVIRMLLTSALVAGAINFGVRILHGGPALTPGSEKFASHLFSHDNVAALLFVPLIALAGMWAWRARGSGRAVVAILALSCVAVLVLLRSKAGLIAAVAGPIGFVAAMAFWRLARASIAHSRARGALLGLATTGLLVALVWLPSRPGVSAFLKEQFNRFVTAADINYNAAYMRPAIWKSIFRMVEEHPLGVGIGNFTVALPPYDLEVTLRSHAHNQFLQVLAETGLIGFLLFAAFIVFVVGAMLVRATAPRPPGDDESYAVDFGVGAAFFVMLLQSVFETPLVFPFTALTWFVLAGIATRRTPPAEPRAIGAIGRGVCAALALGAFYAGTVPAAAPMIQFECFRAGSALLRANEFDAGVAQLERSIEVGFDNYSVRETLAQIYSAKADFGRALVHAERAIELCPNKYELHKVAGICRSRMGATDDALASFDRVDRLLRHSRETGYLRGEALLLGGRLDAAIKAIEDFRETVAESSALLLLLANAYYERAVKTTTLEDGRKAEELYSRFLAVGGSQPGGWVSERIRQIGHWRRTGELLGVPIPPK